MAVKISMEVIEMKEAHEYKTKTDAGYDLFIEAMKLKLDQTQKLKGDTWTTLKIGFLECGFDEEIREFYDAHTLMRKMQELVDVANSCMILYNRYFELWAKETGEKVTIPWLR